MEKIEKLIEKIQVNGDLMEIPDYSGKCYRLIEDDSIYELLNIDGLTEEEIENFYSLYNISSKILENVASVLFNRSIEKETLCLENRMLVSYKNLQKDGLDLSDLEELGKVYFSSEIFSKKLSKYINKNHINMCTEETLLEYVEDNINDVVVDIENLWKSLN